jgi:protein ImuB
MTVSSTTRRRILALHLPRLPTDRLRRDSKTAAGRPPLVVVEKTGNALRLAAVDAEAASLGLAIGQPLADARAMLPRLDVVAADGHGDLELLTRIADWCDRFTPFVALDGARGLLLDVTGSAHLFGGEPAMLGRICDSLRARGFTVHGAIAGTAVAARALAHYRDGAIIVTGGEQEAVAPLSVKALNLDPLTTHAFRRAGLKTVGQVIKRERAEIVARFGAAILDVIDEAVGRGGKPLSPRLPPPVYWQGQKFAEPIATEAAIGASLKSLAAALAAILERHGQGARRLEAKFFRADGAVRRITIETGKPTRDPAIVDRLFREKLETLADPLDPGYGFDGIRLAATRVERAEPEAAELEAGDREEREIGFLIDRLTARFGRHQVRAFRPNDTHIPEAAWVTVPAQDAPPAKLAWRKIREPGGAPRRPLRLFVGPEPVSVTGLATFMPHFLWRGTRHMVTVCEGPERIAMEWWRHRKPKPARDYFRMGDDEGRRYWLYHVATPDETAPRWFLHGTFA